jgi:hypothetical protein
MCYMLLDRQYDWWYILHVAWITISLMICVKRYLIDNIIDDINHMWLDW